MFLAGWGGSSTMNRSRSIPVEMYSIWIDEEIEMKTHAGDGPAAPPALMMNSDRAGCNSASGENTKFSGWRQQSERHACGRLCWENIELPAIVNQRRVGRRTKLSAPPPSSTWKPSLCFLQSHNELEELFFSYRTTMYPAQRKTRKTGSTSSQSGTVQPRIKILSFSSSL